MKRLEQLNAEYNELYDKTDGNRELRRLLQDWLTPIQDRLHIVSEALKRS
jgi:hypothetical protein